MTIQDKKGYIEFTSPYITEAKKELFRQKLADRTRHISIALENIIEPMNASAVIRTTECMGIQDMHIIDDTGKYEPNRWVVRGATNWLDMRKHGSSAEAIASFRENGYKIAATTPHPRGAAQSLSLHDLPVDHKIMLLFGNERDGLSQTVLQNADYAVRIPIYGFTESYNISVSAGICLQHLTYRLRQTEIAWGLSEQEKEEVLYDWYAATLKHHDQYLKEFLRLKEEQLSRSKHSG